MENATVEDPKPQEEGSNRKAIGLIILIILLLVACGVLTYLFIIPLAQPLFIQQATETPVSLGDDEVVTSEPEPTMEPEPTERASACRQTGSMNFLISGVDAPYTDEPKGADAIRLMHIDFSNSEVTVVALPRDMWVTTSPLEFLEIPAERLGLTYYYAKENPPENSDEVVFGTTVLAQTIYDNFGFVPDHYITVHIDNFDDIVDAIGGISVSVPQEYQSVSYLFTPGLHQLNGDQALEYASNLLRDDTEWERLDRQDLVLNAIFDEVTSPQILLDLPALISEFSQTITTDLSPLELTDLACLLDEVSMDDVNYVEVGESMVATEEDSPILYPNYAEITAMLEDIFE